MTAQNVFIYCDHPSHGGRDVAVTNFRPVPGSPGRWFEAPTSRARNDGASSSSWLDGDQPVHGRDVRRSGVRARFSVECRKVRACRQSVTGREDRLFAALDGIAARGLRKVPLAFLAASVEASESERASRPATPDPEPGQG